MLNNGYILDGKYEVIRVLGKGGMGTVYLCKNIRLENLWAIKEVKKDSKNKLDILCEPNILKKLSHSGIPRIVDVFYEKNNFYMVQDYVAGQTLQKYVQEQNFIDIENICKITLEICDIIAYLHSLNPPIIYRDLKPANIMITPEGKVFLIDFGISKVYQEQANIHTTYMGTKGYAAPEQYGVDRCCKETDIYGIGMVMYFMATGKNISTGLEPLVEENYHNIVGIGLRKIIQKCIQIHIRNRYPSIGALKDEITKLSQKYSEENTVVLSNQNSNFNISRRNVRIKKTDKFMLKGGVKELVVFIAIVLVGAYFYYGNVKKDKDAKGLNKVLIDGNVKNLSVLKENDNKGLSEENISKEMYIDDISNDKDSNEEEDEDEGDDEEDEEDEDEEADNKSKVKTKRKKKKTK